MPLSSCARRLSAWRSQCRDSIKQPPLDWWVAVNRTPMIRFFMIIGLAFIMVAANIAIHEGTATVAYGSGAGGATCVLAALVLARCPLPTASAVMTVIMGSFFVTPALQLVSVLTSDDVSYRVRSQSQVFFIWIVAPAIFGIPLLPAAAFLGGMVVLDWTAFFLRQVFHGDPFEMRVAVSSVVCGLGGIAGVCMQTSRLRSIYDIQQELSVEKALMESMLAMMCDAMVWLSDDGSTVAHADHRFEMLVGRSVEEDEQFESSLPDEEHERVLECLQRARASPVLLPTTLVNGSGAKIPVEIFVAGNRNAGKADGRKEQMPAFLIGIKVTSKHGPTDSGISSGSSAGRGLGSGPPGRSPWTGSVDHPGATERKKDAPLDEELQSCAQASLPETTLTGRIFGTVNIDRWMQNAPEEGAAELRSSLARVDALGKAEHWLIRKEELQLDPSEILGSGAFGVVMAGTLHGSSVAVKAAKNSEGVSVKHLVAILNEIRILRHAHHPNIVLCYGSCVEPDRVEVLLVLERVRGPDLSTYVFEHSADDEVHVRLQLLLDVACALRYLHNQPLAIVHGDLKGSNVLVEAAVPRAKLVDFGLSRLLTRSAKPLGGSLAWMAPELILRHASVPKPSADVFSFGRLVYLILACRSPLEGMCADAVRQMAKAGNTAILSWDKRRPLSREGAALCERALRLEPERRPDMGGIHQEALAWQTVARQASKSTPQPPEAERAAAAAAPGNGGGQARGGLAGAMRSLRTAIAGGAVAALACGPPGQAQAPRRGAGETGKPTGTGGGGTSTGTGTDARPETVGGTGLPGTGPPTSSGQETPLPPPLALPRRLPTEAYAKGYMLLDCMQHWNYTLPPGACCGYHAALTDLTRLVRRLMGSPCQGEFAAHHVYQCRTCGMLDSCAHEVCPVCNEPSGPDRGLQSIREEEDATPPEAGRSTTGLQL